jgi:hypothetical protein
MNKLNPMPAPPVETINITGQPFDFRPTPDGLDARCQKCRRVIRFGKRATPVGLLNGMLGHICAPLSIVQDDDTL